MSEVLGGCGSEEGFRAVGLMAYELMSVATLCFAGRCSAVREYGVSLFSSLRCVGSMRRHQWAASALVTPFLQRGITMLKYIDV
jgi:hypothetical protein